MLIYLLARALELFFNLLPHKAALRAGGALGELVYLTGIYRREVALDNIRSAFPDKPPQWHENVARGCFRNLGMVIAESVRGWRMDRRVLRRYVEWDENFSQLRKNFGDMLYEKNQPGPAQPSLPGFENVPMQKRAGRGAIGLTMHFDNWEFLGTAVTAEGIPLSVTFMDIHNPRIHRWLTGGRRRCGIDLINLDAGLGRSVADRLRHGRFVSFINDQDAGPDGIFVEFMGRPASFFRGAALLALRNPVPVFSCIMERDPDRRGEYWRHRVHTVRFPAHDDRRPAHGAKNFSDRQTAFTKRYAELYEKFIRRRPEQYLWTHRRWKTRPSD